MTGLFNSKNKSGPQKIRRSQIFSSYRELHLQDHGRLSVMHISKHSLFSWCWNSQDHGRMSVVHVSKHSHKNLRQQSQDHGWLPDKHISKHSHKNLRSCWTHWYALQKKKQGQWARPPVLTPVPSQAIHSRACVNSHHCDIQGTAQK